MFWSKMVKEVYLGHNQISHQYYINDRGQHTTDKNVSYAGPDNDLQAVVKHMATEYKDRKTILKTDLSEERFSELQRLVEKNKCLKKMELKQNEW